MLTYFFPKQLRLLRSRDFRLCSRYGLERSGQFLHLKMRTTHHGGKQLGLTVSRRFGKATRRNRFKRLVREAFRLSQHQLPDQIHLNVRPGASASRASLLEIQAELLRLTEI